MGSAQGWVCVKALLRFRRAAVKGRTLGPGRC